jgi:hypothetical protein
MSHDKIEGIFYRIKRQDSDFLPINFEEEERRFPKSKRKATASEQKITKKTRFLKKKNFNLRSLQKIS